MAGFWKPETRNEDDFSSVFASPSRMPLVQQRMILPIYKHKRQILYALEKFSVVVIVGETGSGKSTQIPQYLVESGGWAANNFQVVVTQPRRIAAVSLAQRVAQESGSQLGGRVGYSVRFDDKSSPYTQIKYVTDALLLREATLSNPLLSKYSVVMVDEAHERSLNSDAVLGLLKKIRRARKTLRLIVCSATIDAQMFLNFFVGNNDGGDPMATGTIISVDGRQYPVDILYMERPAQDYISSMVETALSIHRNEGPGDILCFLPSGEDIDRAIRMAEERLRGNSSQVVLLPLYGTLPLHMQTRIFQTASSKDAKTRRIVLATNIAETSVTVPGISFVIDSGLVKLPYFDPRTGLERLIVGPISQASARQRAGRAGRLSAGKCFRLFTEDFMVKNLKVQTPPEILRTNLASFVLTLKALGVENILAFDLMDVPSVDALSHGLELLFALGAIDKQTHLTKLGIDLSKFPTEPPVSKMLLESLSAGCSWEVLGVAAALHVRDLFHRPRSRRQQQLLDYEASVASLADPSGDHVTYTNVLAEAEDRSLDEDECKEKYINYIALKRSLEVRNQLASFLRQFGKVEAMGITGDDSRSKAIRRCVTAGFFFNVAKLSNDGRYYTLRKNILVVPASTSIYASHATISSEYIVFGETMDGPRGGIELRAVSAIEASWLREVAPHYWE
jgi:ATP-dependent RNA helicase DDX35